MDEIRINSRAREKCRPGARPLLSPIGRRPSTEQRRQPPGKGLQHDPVSMARPRSGDGSASPSPRPPRTRRRHDPHVRRARCGRRHRADGEHRPLHDDDREPGDDAAVHRHPRQGPRLHHARQPVGLGVSHAVYNQVSTPTCQVYSGRRSARPTRSRRPTGRSSSTSARTSSRRRSRSDGGQRRRAADCKGFDGVSNGPPDQLRDRRPDLAPLDWVAPANPRPPGRGHPHAITLFWTPPADALGVRYQVLEVAASAQTRVRVRHRQRGDDLGPRGGQRALLPPERLPVLGRPLFAPRIQTSRPPSRPIAPPPASAPPVAATGRRRSRARRRKAATKRPSPARSR